MLSSFKIVLWGLYWIARAIDIIFVAVFYPVFWIWAQCCPDSFKWCFMEGNAILNPQARHEELEAAFEKYARNWGFRHG